ncbi:MAG: hypothetical protein KGL39_06930 [Patescibacteria group bacterium]|nr:hypothetical protein [Patescibacteria group bacterium]
MDPLQTPAPAPAATPSLLSRFWNEWEPHLALATGVSVVAVMRWFGHPFSETVEVLIVVGFGGPAVRDAAVSVVKAVKGS